MFPVVSQTIAATVGFLYGAGAETLIFVTGTSGKYPKLFVSRQKNQSQLWIPRKPRKIGVWVSGAEIQTSAVDTRTAVWVSTPEKFSKIVLGKTRNFSRKFRGVSAPALYKNPAFFFHTRNHENHRNHEKHEMTFQNHPLSKYYKFKPFEETREPRISRDTFFENNP